MSKKRSSQAIRPEEDSLESKRAKRRKHSDDPATLEFYHENYIECPNEYFGEGPSIFLGGGISSCPDWQSTARDYLLKACPKLVIFNPRRASFDVSDPSQTEVQIMWEFRYLRKANAILFWFPKETLCPITLYELGQWSVLSQQTRTALFVGTHPEYQRKKDVEFQLALVNSEIRVVDSLDELLRQVEDWYHRRMEMPPDSNQPQGQNKVCSIQ